MNYIVANESGFIIGYFSTQFTSSFAAARDAGEHAKSGNANYSNHENLPRPEWVLEQDALKQSSEAA